jgi:RNA 3'-terminal phosphate cyclase (ATP)
VTVEGGTHNPSAPPFDFLARAFLPLLQRMGARVEARLDRPGFYPAGGGQCTVTVTPVAALSPITLLERGVVRRRHARALVAQLPVKIAERELAVVRRRLGWNDDELESAAIEGETSGPGNVLLLEIESEHVTEVFTGFGRVGVRAETVAEHAVRDARRYVAADVPVGPYLADQLLVPLGLAGGGAFRTTALSAHATTNTDIITAFLGTRFSTKGDRNDVTVRAEPAGRA